MFNTKEVTAIFKLAQKIAIATGYIAPLAVEYSEDYTVIPVTVRQADGTTSRVYEDGMLMVCSHTATEGDAVTQHDGTGEEYTIAALVCLHCDAWYDKASEEWIE